jgi:uncharacterized protein HemY
VTVKALRAAIEADQQQGEYKTRDHHIAKIAKKGCHESLPSDSRPEL